MNCTIDYLMYINDGIDPFRTMSGCGGLGYKPYGNMIGGMAKRDIKTGKITGEFIKPKYVFEETKGDDEVPELVDIEQMPLSTLAEKIEESKDMTEEEKEDRLISEIDDVIEIYNNEKTPVMTDEQKNEYIEALDSLKTHSNPYISEYIDLIKNRIDKNIEINKSDIITSLINVYDVAGERGYEQLITAYKQNKKSNPEFNRIEEERKKIREYGMALQEDPVLRKEKYYDQSTRITLFSNLMKGLKNDEKIRKEKENILDNFDTFYSNLTPEQLQSQINELKNIFSQTGQSYDERYKKYINEAKKQGMKGRMAEISATKKMIKAKITVEKNDYENDERNVKTLLADMQQKHKTLSNKNSSQEDKDKAVDFLYEMYMELMGRQQIKDMGNILQERNNESDRLREQALKILSDEAKQKLGRLKPSVATEESEFFNRMSAVPALERGRISEKELMENESLLTSLDGDNSTPKFTTDMEALGNGFRRRLKEKRFDNLNLITKDPLDPNKDYRKRVLDQLPVDIIKDNTVWELKSFESPKPYESTKFYKSQPMYIYIGPDGRKYKEYHAYTYEYMVKNPSGDLRGKILPDIQPTDEMIGLKNILVNITTYPLDSKGDKIKEEKVVEQCDLLPYKGVTGYYNYYILESGKKNIKYLNVIDDINNIKHNVISTPNYSERHESFEIPLTQEKFKKLPRTYEKQLLKSMKGNKKSFMEARIK